jgi:hypothetical protein
MVVAGGATSTVVGVAAVVADWLSKVTVYLVLPLTVTVIVVVCVTPPLEIVAVRVTGLSPESELGWVTAPVAEITVGSEDSQVMAVPAEPLPGK